MLRAFIFLLGGLVLLIPQVAVAEPLPLAEVVRRTIATNPEIQARWQAFEAAGHERRAARGGYLPRIDLTGRVGYQDVSTPNTDEEFQPAEFSASLTQLLFDGFATSTQVAKLGHARAARYFDLLAGAESVGLEAASAYLDVLRYRELRGLAEENLKQHNKIFRQVEERVLAGISRGVDLDQATGRLALADSNLITETTNLHDVSARYLRLVGELPPTEMQLPEQFAALIPEQVGLALQQALKEHPGFLAAGENLLAAKQERDQRKAPFMPHLELRARHDEGYERDKISGRSDENVVELVLNYNLYRGGSDVASFKQFKRNLGRARDLRSKSCRDIRQTLTIAYHDIQRLAEQLTYLHTHQASIARAREAYRKQFDIGQRTLLDLLDTENEYFQARRAYVNALYSHRTAEVRTLAGMGHLLPALDVRREGLPDRADVLSAGMDELARETACPAEAVEEVLLRIEPTPMASAGKTAGRSRVVPAVKDVSDEPAPAAVPEPEVKVAVLAPVADVAEVPRVPPAKVPAAEAFPQRLEIEFAAGEAVLPAGYLPVIARLTDYLKQHPEAWVVVEGYPAGSGHRAVELRLTRSRVDALRSRLIYAYAVDADRVVTSWFSAPQSRVVDSPGSERPAGQVVLQIKQ